MTDRRAASPTRRLALQGLALPALAALGLPGCTPADSPLLRVGAQPWVGYELMYLARQRQYFAQDQVRLVEVPTASASLRALSAGTLEGAGLTLDEVLSARARGLALQVVAVFDVSHGADVLLARPGIDTLPALKGRRVGVEQSATGALMLDAALTHAQLYPTDVTMVPLAFNEHASAFKAGKVDALVTFDPVCSQLVRDGAKPLFTSADVPGLIVDVLAVRADAVALRATSLQALVAGIFRAQADWQRDPAGIAPLLAPRLHLTPAEVVRAFGGLQLPDLPANRRWLVGPPPQLLQTASRVVEVMRRAALIGADGGAIGDNLIAPGFLPAT